VNGHNGMLSLIMQETVQPEQYIIYHLDNKRVGIFFKI